MDYLRGTEPAKYGQFINKILTELHEAYPTGKIESISKTNYCLASLAAFRLGYPDVVSMLDDYGFHFIKIPGKRLMRVDAWSDEELRSGIVFPTILPDDNKVKGVGVFAYKVNYLYGDCSCGGSVDEESFLDAREKYLRLVQKIDDVIEGAPEIDRDGIGFRIRVNHAWFNDRTDMLILQKVTETENINFPEEFFDQKTITHGYEMIYSRTAEGQERRRIRAKQYMALAALFLYPGCDVVIEVFRHADNSFATADYWSKDKIEHPGRDFLIVNSDTGVVIRHFEDMYKCTAGKDEKSLAYQKMLKKSCPEDYVEFRIEGRTRFIRIPKELKDDRVCVDGVPLDLYECIHFDPDINAYVISNLKKYDFDLKKVTFDGLDFVMGKTELDWGREIMRTLDSDNSMSFPAVPRVDALHRFLNRVEPVHSRIAMEDLENAAYLINYTPTNIGNMEDVLVIKTTTGDRIGIYRNWEYKRRFELFPKYMD